MKMKAEKILEPRIKSPEDRTNKPSLTISLSGPSVTNIPIGDLLSETSEIFNYKLNPEYKSLIFLRDFSTDIDLIAKDDEVKQFLGKLNAEEINSFRGLKAFRRGYLEEILASQEGEDQNTLEA